ncbi:UPF0598 protein CG30010 [Drosophila hydei]|uniref:UPF0598 protein CG30010 n=1 Tax=Drosophila hydei TaxID=7224 RepID=A0A6J1LU99_DROHY|nr:UPF0598 protein CG30010 [Drosophila hydei]
MAGIAVLHTKNLVFKNWKFNWIPRRTVAIYTQGQSPEPRIREYFYYIDHEGMLFLDDAKMKNFTSCFKEKKFLKFFFSRLRVNATQRYEMFPYMSPCGRERNYIRCDDTPIVFTEHLKKDAGGRADHVLTYAHGGPDLSIPFQPHKLYMHPKTGRVYHPAWPQVGGIGLVRSKLAIELSQNFVFTSEEKPPTHFRWDDTELKLEHEWIKDCEKFILNSKL